MRKFGIEIELESINIEKFTECFSLPFTHCGITDFSECTMEGQVFPNGYRRHIDGCVRCGADMKTYWHIIYEAVHVEGLLYEIVSPIMSDFEQLKVLCKALVLSNATVNPERGGLHVHIDANGMPDQKIIDIIKSYQNMETDIDRMVAKRRRGDNNVVCAGSLIDIELSNVSTVKELLKAFGHKCYKVNPFSLKKYGTIEFRQHEATIEFQKIKNWCLFIQELCS